MDVKKEKNYKWIIKQNESKHEEDAFILIKFKSKMKIKTIPKLKMQLTIAMQWGAIRFESV